MKIEINSINYRNQSRRLSNDSPMGNQGKSFKQVLVDSYEPSLEKGEQYTYTIPVKPKQAESVALGNITTKSDQQGEGKLFFPPDSAPEEVKKAYESLSKEEQRTIGTLAFAMQANKNMRVDSFGGIYILNPGDKGYVNLFEREGFTYSKFADEMMDLAELQKNYNRKLVYDGYVSAVNKFKEALTRQLS